MEYYGAYCLIELSGKPIPNGNDNDDSDNSEFFHLQAAKVIAAIVTERNPITAYVRLFAPSLPFHMSEDER